MSPFSPALSKREQNDCLPVYGSLKEQDRDQDGIRKAIRKRRSDRDTSLVLVALSTRSQLALIFARHHAKELDRVRMSIERGRPDGDEMAQGNGKRSQVGADRSSGQGKPAHRRPRRQANYALFVKRPDSLIN